MVITSLIQNFNKLVIYWLEILGFAYIGHLLDFIIPHPERPIFIVIKDHISVSKLFRMDFKSVLNQLIDF